MAKRNGLHLVCQRFFAEAPKCYGCPNGDVCDREGFVPTGYIHPPMTNPPRRAKPVRVVAMLEPGEACPNCPVSDLCHRAQCPSAPVLIEAEGAEA